MGLVNSVKTISNKAIKYLYHVGITESRKSNLEYLLKEHFRISNFRQCQYLVSEVADCLVLHITKNKYVSQLTTPFLSLLLEN